jgi:hypothetical protein
VGNPNNPAYVPDYYLPYSSSMGFLERFHNTAYYLWNRYEYLYRMLLSVSLCHQYTTLQ